MRLRKGPGQIPAGPVIAPPKWRVSRCNPAHHRSPGHHVDGGSSAENLRRLERDQVAALVWTPAKLRASRYGLRSMTRRAQRNVLKACRPMLSSTLLAERRLAVLVGHLLADGGDLASHFKHDPLDVAPGRKITTRRSSRRWMPRRRSSSGSASSSRRSSTRCAA